MKCSVETILIKLLIGRGWFHETSNLQKTLAWIKFFLCGGLFPFFGGNVFEEGDVGGVSEGVEFLVFECFFDGAVGLVDVGAGFELAVGGEGGKVGEDCKDCGGIVFPKAKAFNAGGVDTEGIVFQGDEFGSCCGVGPFVGFMSNRTDGEGTSKARIDKGGFSDSGLP